MSALARRPEKRIPTFTTSEYVDIDIDPEELEAAGWRYVGDEKDGQPVIAEEKALDIVHRWHDDTHDGPWQWCAEEPCDSLRGRPHDGKH